MANETRIKERLSRLLSHTQRGSWESFQPLFQCLRQLDLLSALGLLSSAIGTASPPPSDRLPAISSPMPFPLGIYGEMLKLINEVRWNTPEEKALTLKPVWDWANKFGMAFSPALVEEHWTIGRLRKVAEDTLKPLIPRIEEQLLFMEG